MSWSFFARPHPMLPPAAEYELPDFELRDESQVGSSLCFGLHAVADAAGFAQEQGGFEWHGGSSGFGTRSGIGQERLLVAGHEISDMNDTGCAPRLASAMRRHAVAHADLAFCSVPDVIWCVPLPEPTCLLLGLGQGRVAQRGRSAFAVVPASARDRSLCTTRRIACCRRMA